MLLTTGQNRRTFSAICHNDFGRKVIYTQAAEITAENVVEELNKALGIHEQNVIEIDYLDRYYRGDQPILYRQKKIRPEVNNRIVQNLALMIVETKASEMVGEPIQYVLRGTDDEKSEQVGRLNALMESEDKAFYDIELCRWRSICGTAYRFITDSEESPLLDEASFSISTENPMKTFVVYYGDTNKPAFSCQIRKNAKNENVYNIYTDRFFFLVSGGEVKSISLNGNRAIPVIEYPNNERRLSDIELTISITDEINKLAADRSNGIEQFVSSWIRFINCEIDPETFAQMRQEGALVVKSNNGTENKASVDVMTSELNQTQSQVVVSDMFEKLLFIQGIANREGNTGGDTAGAVMMRNGFYSQEKRSEINEPIFKRAERNALRIVLNILRINDAFTLLPSDIEIKISRTKSDNLYTKAESLKMMLDSGIYPARAIKSVGIWSDPEQVAIESKERMDVLYPTEPEAVEQSNRISEKPNENMLNASTFNG